MALQWRRTYHLLVQTMHMLLHRISLLVEHIPAQLKLQRHIQFPSNNHRVLLEHRNTSSSPLSILNSRHSHTIKIRSILVTIKSSNKSNSNSNSSILNEKALWAVLPWTSKQLWLLIHQIWHKQWWINRLHWIPFQKITYNHNQTIHHTLINLRSVFSHIVLMN